MKHSLHHVFQACELVWKTKFVVFLLGILYFANLQAQIVVSSHTLESSHDITIDGFGYDATFYIELTNNSGLTQNFSLTDIITPNQMGYFDSYYDYEDISTGSVSLPIGSNTDIIEWSGSIPAWGTATAHFGFSFGGLCNATTSSIIFTNDIGGSTANVTFNTYLPLNAVPEFSIDQCCGSKMVCFNNLSSASGGSGEYIYLWYYGNLALNYPNCSPSVTTFFTPYDHCFTYEENGTYNVCLEMLDAMTGCSNFICHTVVVNDAITNMVLDMPISGNANDISGNSNHGTVVGATLVSDRNGNANSAYWFDGIDDQIDIADNTTLDLNDTYTIMAWVKPEAGYGDFKDNHVAVISKWGNGGVGNAAYSLDIWTGGHLFSGVHHGGIGGTYLVSNGIIPANGTWTHVAVTRSCDDSLRLYINGVLDKTQYSVVPQNSTFPLTIGMEADPAIQAVHPTRYRYHGAIDEIKIYKCGLSLELIRGNAGIDCSTSVTLSAIHPTCGQCNGSLTATASNGTPPYTFAWPYWFGSGNNTGPNTNTITGLCYEMYTVTVTDAMGCTATATITLEPSNATAPQANLTTTNTTCGECNGSISSNPTGGTPNYTYNWSNGATTQNLTGLCSGSYTVTVTDGNGCTATQTAVILPSVPPQVNLITTNTTCGECNGSISSNPTGGTPNYTYNWSNGATTQNLTGLCSGSYTVTITDAMGCTATQTAVILPSTPISAYISSVLYNCSYYQLTAHAIGGTAPYTYTWDNAPPTQTINISNAGTYNVTITDVMGCTATASIVQTIYPSLALLPNLTTVSTTCGQCDGSISSNPTGGTPNYTYNWSNGATTQNLTGLCSGSYTVTVTDGNGCTATQTAVILPSVPPQVNLITTNTTCGECNGSISSNPTGGTPNYTYNWSNGATTQNLTGLCSGSYTVTITDAMGCTAMASTNVATNSPPVVSITETQTICQGDCTTITAITPTGLTYQWNGDNTLFDDTPSIMVCPTPPVFGLVPIYTVTVTDAYGCTATASTTVVVNPLPIVSISGPSSFCVGSSATLTASGGTTYSWSNGGTASTKVVTTAGTYTVTVTNSLGCTATASKIVTTQYCDPCGDCPVGAVNISTGINNNTGLAIPQGSPDDTWTLIAGPAGTNLVANPNSAWANQMNGKSYWLGHGSGGNTGLYIYSHTIVVPPCMTAQLCIGWLGADDNINFSIDGVNVYSWVSGAFTNANAYRNPPITATLGAGTHTLIANINNTVSAGGFLLQGCYTLTPNAPISVSLQSTTTQCSNPCNGAINTTVTGGTPGSHSFAWSNGATTQNLTGLCPGTYTVTITDSNGCTATANRQVTCCNSLVGTVTPAETIATGTFIYTSQTIDITGTPPYSFNWDNSGYVRYDIVYTAVGATITIYYSDNATWACTITNNNSCGASSLSFSNQEDLPSIPLLDIDNYSITAQSTTALPNGAINIAVSGGGCTTSQYTYLWAGPNGFTATTEDIVGLVSGWCTVIVTCPVTGQSTTGWYWVPTQRRGRTKVEGAESFISIAPNPFNNESTIEFYSEKGGHTVVRVYAMDGREVAVLYNDETEADMTYSVSFNGSNLSNGAYNVVLIDADGNRLVKRAILIK